MYGPGMSDIKPGTQAWLDQVREDILEPERRILDPHHHLWRRPEFGSYELQDLWRDTNTGHRVEKTVFIECRAFYRESGPDHLRSVGETEAIAAMASVSPTERR